MSFYYYFESAMYNVPYHICDISTKYVYTHVVQLYILSHDNQGNIRSQIYSEKMALNSFMGQLGEEGDVEGGRAECLHKS